MKIKRFWLSIGLILSILFIVACSADLPVFDSGRGLGDNEIAVHFIDVGQGDAILIQLGSGENILIDAGDISKGELVLTYLKKQGVTKIDHLIATHPHADHIGGMPLIIENLDIAKVYIPRATHTSQTYENLLLSIKNKGLKITEAKAGVRLDVDNQYHAEFLAPNNKGYESLNDYSAVLRLEYIDHAFLLTGDAEAVSGQEILSAGHNIKAQVLQVPHHGSNNSCLSEEFLDLASPQIAVISLGADNRYGHPHQEVLDRLEARGVQVLRTDLDGNIVVYSDGKDLQLNKGLVLNTEKVRDMSQKAATTSEEKQVESQSAEIYIGNKNSKVFHIPECSGLPVEHNRIYIEQRKEAIQQGFRPCQNCKP